VPSVAPRDLVQSLLYQSQLNCSSSATGVNTRVGAVSVPLIEVPLIEVPVLLSLVYGALWLRRRLTWPDTENRTGVDRQQGLAGSQT